MAMRQERESLGEMPEVGQRDYFFAPDRELYEQCSHRYEVKTRRGGRYRLSPNSQRWVVRRCRLCGVEEGRGEQ